MSHVIYPYSAPITLRPNLFQVRGSLPFPIPRNMTIWRADSGELVIYSAIAMHDEGMRALEALGTPAVMVIPHRRHQMDAPFYEARYPKLRVLAPDGAPVRGVQVDGGLAELSRFGIDAYVLPSNTYFDVVLDLPVSDGRALVVCESLGNVKLEGFLGVMFRVLGPPGGGFGVARAVRMREIRDAGKLRAWLEKQSERAEVCALLFGHGDAMTTDVQARLREAATKL